MPLENPPPSGVATSAWPCSAPLGRGRSLRQGHEMPRVGAVVGAGVSAASQQREQPPPPPPPPQQIPQFVRYLN